MLTLAEFYTGPVELPPLPATAVYDLRRAGIGALLREGKMLRDPKTIPSSALRELLVADLTALVSDICAARAGTSLACSEPDGQPVADPQILLLIDDVHRFDSAAGLLVHDLLGVDGLKLAGRHPIKTAFTFSGSKTGARQAYSSGLTAITAFLEQGQQQMRHYELGVFRRGDEERLAYRQFLLHYTPSLVINARDEDEEAVLDLLGEDIRGIPSQLTNPAVKKTIRDALRFRALAEADDDTLLRQQMGVGRGG
jgi:hypothetical protein